MNILLNKHSANLDGEVILSSSKSESNRALLIKALATNSVTLNNLSDAKDTQTMQRLLEKDSGEWDVSDAGTTMRFLTAYLAVYGHNAIITGSQRMKERPIGPLVDALRLLGAKVEYLESEGYPPLRINKIEDQQAKEIQIPGNISSQYISALLMIAPTLDQGLTIELTTEIFSRPYIEMTLSLMNRFGVNCQLKSNKISVPCVPYQSGAYTIESDWSGASYWYSMIALSDRMESTVTLPNLRENSFQGDRRIADIMVNLGVETEFLNNGIKLSKKEFNAEHLELDLKDCPDLAQTVMVVAGVKGSSISFTGLESLKIKETDRVHAMKTELKKIGVLLTEEKDRWELKPSDSLPQKVTIETYKDHRMAMAFAPLCQQMNVSIQDAEVIKKSYPMFWEALKKVGVQIT